MKLIRFAASLSIALTAGALGAVGVATMTTPAVAHASSVGAKISRTEVIDRAKYWYNRGDTWYSQKQSDAISDGTGGAYRPDCSGFVSMAWHLPKKTDGWDFNVGDFTNGPSPSAPGWAGDSRIGLDSLLPGDAIVSNDGTSHIELFDQWANPADHSQGIWTYGEHDFGRKTEHDKMSWSYLKSNFFGLHYNNIIDDASPRQVYEASSANGWQDLPMTGVTGSSVAAIEMGGVKYVYTVDNGQIYEASSANGWQDLPTGVSGSGLAAIAVNGTKFIYTIANGQVYEASSANGWQALPTGVAGSTVAAATMNGTKFIYTVRNGQIYEASSANGWQALPMGVAGTTVAAIALNGTKYVYTINNGQVYEASSANGWQALPMGVAASAVAATTLDGVKYVYTVSGGQVYEASSANGWQALPMGVNGTTIAAIAFNGTKYLYNL
jgi:predicted heme/steroid binding protein